MPRVAILQGTTSDGRTHTVAIPSGGPAWPLRQTTSGEWMCRCRSFWANGACEHAGAVQAWHARPTRDHPTNQGAQAP